MRYTRSGKNIDLTEYQEQQEVVRKRAEKLQQSIHERGWELAASVGIGRCSCSLHNASIDDKMTGWCARNPERLRIAKIAVKLVSDCSVWRIGQRITERIHNRFAEKAGWPKVEPYKREDEADFHLLFAKVSRLSGKEEA